MNQRWNGMGRTSANHNDESGSALAGNRNLNTNGLLDELSLWDSVRFVASGGRDLGLGILT